MHIRVLLSLLFAFSSLFAEVDEKLKLSIGGMFVTNFSTQMQITPHAVPVSVLVDTNKNLGMEYETGVFRLDGVYRFTDVHSIDFSYYRVRSNGEKVVEREFLWGDDYTIGAGANVASYFNMSIYKINYGYSFYHNEKVELLVNAGLHITRVELGLSASGNVKDKDGVLITGVYKDAASGTIPLPVFGFKGEYSVNKNLFVSYKSEYFVLNIDEYRGAFISNALTAEYRFMQYYSVGAGFSANKMALEGKGDKVDYKVQNSLSGLVVNFSYIY